MNGSSPIKLIMRFNNKILMVLFSSCVLVKLGGCTDRRSPRRSQPDKDVPQVQTAQITRDQQAASRLETVVLAKLEKIEKFEETTVGILEGLIEKLDRVHDKLLNDLLNCEAAKSMNDKLTSFGDKISDLNNKINQLINQGDKISGVKNDFKVTNGTKLNDTENMNQQLKDSLQSFGEKIHQNGEKLDYLSGFFLDLNVNKEQDEDFMQIPRKERRISDHQKLINKILSVVKNRLGQKREDDTGKTTESSGSLTDIVSSFENMKSTTSVQKNKTTSSSRKGGLIFPNVRNKPSKINTTTFASEYFGNKDIRVSRLRCLWLKLVVAMIGLNEGVAVSAISLLMTSTGRVQYLHNLVTFNESFLIALPSLMNS